MVGIIIGIAGLLTILGVALFTYINRNKEQEAGTPPAGRRGVVAHMQYVRKDSKK